MRLDVYRNPWINAKYVDGHRDILSLRECIIQAKSIYSLSIDGAKFALDNTVPYTLLTLLLGRVFRPCRDDKLEMLDTGKFDINKIDSYIEECEKDGISFDVFDERRPFLQDPAKRDDVKVSTVGVLDPLMVSGNNTAFYHNIDFHTCGKPVEDSLRMTPPQFIASVARNHMYHGSIGCKGCATGYYNSSQPPLHCIIHGKNLFETLVISVPSGLCGVPLWERPYDMTIPEIVKKYKKLDYLSAAFLPVISVRYGEIEDGKIKSILYNGNIYENDKKNKPQTFKPLYFVKGDTGFNCFIRESDKKETWPLKLSANAGDLTPTVMQLVQNINETGDYNFIHDAINEKLLSGPFHFMVFGGTFSSMNKDEPQSMTFDVPVPEELIDKSVNEIVKKVAAFADYASWNLKKQLISAEKEATHSKNIDANGAIYTISRHFAEYVCDQLVPNKQLHNTWIERIIKDPTEETKEKILDEIIKDTMAAYMSYKTKDIFVAATHADILGKTLKKAKEKKEPDKDKSKKKKGEKDQDEGK